MLQKSGRICIPWQTARQVRAYYVNFMHARGAHIKNSGKQLLSRRALLPRYHARIGLPNSFDYVTYVTSLQERSDSSRRFPFARPIADQVAAYRSGSSQSDLSK